MNLNDYKELIENKLDIKNHLLLEDNKLIPNKLLITKSYIKKYLLDDLFEYHLGKLVFKNRLLHAVGEITNRQVVCSHYFLELRE